MKCVVGVDLEGHAGSVIAWLGRLQLAIKETILVHATEPLPVTMAASGFGMLVEGDQILKSINQSGQEVLDDARAQALGAELKPKTQLCCGPPALTLMDAAEQDGADLIAVTSTVRSSAGSVFGGSVARGLAISAKQSVMICREAMPADRPIHAVFAFDQSPYCAACIKLLAQFAPKGISQLTLLTVQEPSKHHGLQSKIEASLTAPGEETAKWLSERGIPTTLQIETGRVEETIHDFMHDSQADLLVVGSQGHGFVERMVVGSTALHEVINERYPVLLLRCRPAAGV